MYGAGAEVRQPMKKSRSYWQSELLSRQRNLDPIRTLRNIVSFEGVLYRGIEHPSALQRVGAWIIGGMLVSAGTTIAWYERLALAESIQHKNIVTLIFVVFGLFMAALSFGVGMVIVFKAAIMLRRPKARRRKK